MLTQSESCSNSSLCCPSTSKPLDAVVQLVAVRIWVDICFSRTAPLGNHMGGTDPEAHGGKTTVLKASVTVWLGQSTASAEGLIWGRRWDRKRRVEFLPLAGWNQAITFDQFLVLETKSYSQRRCYSVACVCFLKINSYIFLLLKDWIGRTCLFSSLVLP